MPQDRRGDEYSQPGEDEQNQSRREDHSCKREQTGVQALDHVHSGFHDSKTQAPLAEERGGKCRTELDAARL